MRQGEAVPTLLELLDGKKPANSAAIRVDVVPGTLWRYSGGGYEVMQQLVTDVTGKPFAQLAKEIVLDPLGMTHSTFEQPLPGRLEGNAASGHDGERQDDSRPLAYLSRNDRGGTLDDAFRPRARGRWSCSMAVIS